MVDDAFPKPRRGREARAAGIPESRPEGMIRPAGLGQDTAAAQTVLEEPSSPQIPQYVNDDEAGVDGKSPPPRVEPTPAPRVPGSPRLRSVAKMRRSSPSTATHDVRTAKKSSVMQIVKWLVTTIVVLGGLGAYAAFNSSNGGLGSGNGFSVGGSDRKYGYYHDRTYSNDYGPQYDRDSGASEQKWVYDGPYEYGRYGSKGMSERARGRTSDGTTPSDPLYSSVDYGSDLFEYYANGDVDPTGGYPVGDPVMIDVSTAYNPHAEYSNPYLNRIRLTWGAGYGLGEAPREP